MEETGINNSEEKNAGEPQSRFSKLYWITLKYLSIAWFIYSIFALFKGWEHSYTSLILPLFLILALWKPNPLGYIFLISVGITQVFIGLRHVLPIFELDRISFIFSLRRIAVYLAYNLAIPAVIGIGTYYFIRCRDIFVRNNESFDKVIKITMLSFAMLIGTLPFIERSFDPEYISRTMEKDIVYSQPKDKQSIYIKGKTILKPGFHPHSVVFSPDSKEIAANGILSRDIIIWDVNSGKRTKALTEAPGSAEALAWSPDGKYIVTGRLFVKSGRKTIPAINIWDAKNGRLLKNIDAHDNVDSGSISFSPDGKYFVAGYSPKNSRQREDIYLYETETNSVAKIISTPDGCFCPPVFSPDGNYLAYCVTYIEKNGYRSLGDGLEFIDVSSGRMVKMIHDNPFRNNSINSIKYSPDGKYILTGGQDMLLRIYEVSTGKLIRVFAGHTSIIKSVAFSPDGKYILSGSSDKTVRLWDVQAKGNIAVIDIETSLYDVAFSPDGRYFACGAGQRVMIWEMVNKNQ